MENLFALLQQEIRAVRDRLDGSLPDVSIRVTVARLVLDAIDACQPVMLPVQKLHLVNAVGSLCLKGAHGERLTVSDLRICLADLQKAVAGDLAAEDDAASRPLSDLVTQEILRHTALACLERFSQAAPAADQSGAGPVLARAMIRKNASSSNRDAP